jgi:HAMP domain-containing protein
MTLLSRLCLLLGVALLPAAAIQMYNEFELHHLREIEVQNQAISLAKLAGAEEQQIVQGFREVLITMSELPSIKAKDREACDAYLAVMQQRFPAFITFLVTDQNGVSFCDTNSDHRPINISGRKYFATLVKTRAFTVGEFSAGLSTGRRVIQFALPFFDTDGRMAGVIVAGLSLDWLGDYIARKGVPEGASLGIADRNGVYLARYPNSDRFVGTKMPGNEYQGAGTHNAVDIRDRDGVERIVGYSTLDGDSGGIIVSFGLNKTQAFAEIRQRTQQEIILIVLSMTLVVLLAWFGAQRFIHRPVSQLVDAANQWSLGRYDQRVDIRDKSDISRVADAFNAMAAALDLRERELSQAKEKAEEAAARITMIFESTTDSVLIVDRNWCISYLNSPARSQLAEGRDIIDMCVRDAFLDELGPDIHNRLQQIMADEMPGSLEVFWARRGIWYAINAFPSGRGLAIFCRDITEQPAYSGFRQSRTHRQDSGA